MPTFELPPVSQLWLPPKPAIIRAARAGDLLRARAGRHGAFQGMTFPFPVFLPTGPPALITYLDRDSLQAQQSTFNFTNIAFGPAASNRIVVVGAVYVQDGNTGFSSITIGGVGATVHQSTGTATPGAHAGIAIASANVPTGTTGTVSVAFSAVMDRCGIIVWYTTNPVVYHHSALTRNFGSVNSASVNLNVPAQGAIAAIAMTGEDAELDQTFTGITRVADPLTVGGTFHAYFGGANGNMGEEFGRTITATEPGDPVWVAQIAAVSFAPVSL